MKKEDSRKEILESVKKFVQQSEEKQRVQMITDAIGERRDRDLLDIVSQIEQDWGWKETINHLLKVCDFQYSLPLGAGPIKVKPEELKFRETIFLLLTCNGFEPAPIATEDLLIHLQTAESLVEASNMARDYIESLVTKQVESGDTLFYDTTFFDSSISRSLVESIKNNQQDQLQRISLKQIDDEYDILPLWYNEIGRRTLSVIGIKGNTINSDQLEVVLSVIPQHLSVKKEVQLFKQPLIEPTNEVYRTLLSSMITHEMDNLCILSSRLSYPIVKAILEEALDLYNKEQTSERYRNILNAINAHIRIRAIDSISLMEHLAHIKNPRLATAAITALGNYYHESAASALVDLLCRTTNQEIAKVTTNAILNVSKRCPETRFVIIHALEFNSCTQITHLKRLQKEIIGRRIFYYD